jgi:hypothetical protein
MFVVKKSSSYFWPVTIETPKDGGQYDKESFEVEFKRLPTSEVKKLFEGADRGEPRGKKDVDFCKENVVGWKGVKGESGEDIPFSLSALEQILEFPTVDRRIAEAFLESLAGSRLKNS